jgi:hypothetical protein
LKKEIFRIGAPFKVQVRFFFFFFFFFTTFGAHKFECFFFLLMSASSSSTSTTTGSIMSITSTLNSMNLKENPTSVTATVQKKENVSQTSLTIPIIYLVVDSSKSCLEQCTQVAKSQADCAQYNGVDNNNAPQHPLAIGATACVGVDHSAICSQDCSASSSMTASAASSSISYAKKKKKKDFSKN